MDMGSLLTVIIVSMAIATFVVHELPLPIYNYFQKTLHRTLFKLLSCVKCLTFWIILVAGLFIAREDALIYAAAFQKSYPHFFFLPSLKEYFMSAWIGWFIAWLIFEILSVLERRK